MAGDWELSLWRTLGNKVAKLLPHHVRAGDTFVQVYYDWKCYILVSLGSHFIRIITRKYWFAFICVKYDDVFTRDHWKKLLNASFRMKRERLCIITRSFSLHKMCWCYNLLFDSKFMFQITLIVKDFHNIFWLL